jgi:hypothetical protein
MRWLRRRSGAVVEWFLLALNGVSAGDGKRFRARAALVALSADRFTRLLDHLAIKLYSRHPAKNQ